MIRLYNTKTDIENKNLSVQTNFWNSVPANLVLGYYFQKLVITH